MITDSEIAKLPPEEQAVIRHEIERNEKLGYQRRFLLLSRDGSVLYDVEAVSDASQHQMVVRASKKQAGSQRSSEDSL